MRRKLIFPVLFLVAVFITSCQKEPVELSGNSKTESPIENSSIGAIDVESNVIRFNEIVATNKERLSKLGNVASRNCVETARVPEDYATIQEAVDAVCDYGDVIVNGGTYVEIVVINKPGIHLKGNDDATLEGLFIVSPGGDDVKINNFNVVMIYGNGIFGNGVSGVQVMHNTVTGDQGAAILFLSSNDVSIMHNEVSGTMWGIGFASFILGGCMNNTISHNTVTEIYYSGPIMLQGDTDYSLVNGNTFFDNTNIWGGSIYLLSGLEGLVAGYCENNVVKNNTATNNSTPGFYMLWGGSDNTIGPNNNFSSNTYGILMSAETSNNHVFNNTAKNNSVCGIVDEGGTGNTYKNNKADCTSGI